MEIRATMEVVHQSMRLDTEEVVENQSILRVMHNKAKSAVNIASRSKEIKISNPDKYSDEDEDR